MSDPQRSVARYLDGWLGGPGAWRRTAPPDPSEVNMEAAREILECLTGNGWRIVRFTEGYNGYPVPMTDPDGEAVLAEEWTPG